MVLLAVRHGMRCSEITDLRLGQLELAWEPPGPVFFNVKVGTDLPESALAEIMEFPGDLKQWHALVLHDQVAFR